MLRVENLVSGYGSLKAIQGVSLHVSAGEIVTLIGANGSGKSTILASLAGVIRPMSGCILWDDIDIAALTPEERVRRGIALVPEGRQLFAPMTVYENLQLGAYGRRSDGAEETMRQILEFFPILRERSQQAAGTLSGGEQQMLAIGRALMSKPRLLLLDEPSMGLAPRISKEIFQSLAGLRDDETGILLVEQNAHLAFQTASRGYVIEAGHIVLEGECDSLRKNKDVQRAYLGREYSDIWE